MFLRLRRLVLCFAVVAAAGAIGYAPKFWSAPRPADVPYGVSLIPGTDNFGTQDFAIHLNFLRQTWHESIRHPYQLEDQERIAKNWYPRMATGFPMAYSPVALVLALPLLAISPESAYFVVTFLNAALLLLLTWLYLLPRMTNSVQAGAVLATLCGYALFDVFWMGQTSIATSCLLAAGFMLLEKRAKQNESARLLHDLMLALCLYLLVVKPSVALVLIALLVSEHAWKSLILAGSALLLTWLLLAKHYGGYVAGLQDYLWLLNHFCLADMTPFMRAGLPPSTDTNLTAFLTVLFPQQNGVAFLISRLLFEGLILLLVILRWFQRIDLSCQFQGLLWSFLLFSPHLLVTEDIAICLLAVQGTFFRPGTGALLKVLLIFVPVNLCFLLVMQGIGSWMALPLFFVIKLVLACWWLSDILTFQPRWKKGSIGWLDRQTPVAV